MCSFEVIELNFSYKLQEVFQPYFLFLLKVNYKRWLIAEQLPNKIDKLLKRVDVLKVFIKVSGIIYIIFSENCYFWRNKKFLKIIKFCLKLKKWANIIMFYRIAVFS